MSFLDCIGYIMSNSGMGDALEMTYAEITEHQLHSGKAVDKAIRGYQMVNTALRTILLEDIIGSIDMDLDSIKQLLQEAIKGHLNVNSITSSEVLKKSTKIKSKLSTFTSNHIAKLWQTLLEKINA